MVRREKEIRSSVRRGMHRRRKFETLKLDSRAKPEMGCQAVTVETSPGDIPDFLHKNMQTGKKQVQRKISSWPRKE